MFVFGVYISIYNPVMLSYFLRSMIVPITIEQDAIIFSIRAMIMIDISTLSLLWDDFL